MKLQLDLVTAQKDLHRAGCEFNHANSIGVPDQYLPVDYGTRSIDAKNGFVHASAKVKP